MNFPTNQLPDRTSIELPQYIGSMEEFDTSDVIVQPIQNLGLGVVLTFEYLVMRDRYEDLFAFYKWCQKRRRFFLPAELLAEYPQKFRDVLTLMKAQYWVISSNWNPAPQIINSDYQMYQVKFSVKSV